MVVSGLMFDGLYFEVYQQLVTIYKTTIYESRKQIGFLINDIIYKILKQWLNSDRQLSGK